METTPTTFSPWSTGRWRTRCEVIEPHALIGGLLRLDVEHGRAHDLPYARLAGVLALEDHSAGIVAFGDDAGQLSADQHHQRANLLLRHVFDRLVDGGFRRNGPDGVAF